MQILVPAVLKKCRNSINTLKLLFQRLEKDCGVFLTFKDSVKRKISPDIFTWSKNEVFEGRYDSRA
jgi:hypothetical protein